MRLGFGAVWRRVRTWLLVLTAAFLSAPAMPTDPLPAGSGAAAAPQWVAIAPRRAVRELERLAQHRASRGFEGAQVIALEDIIPGTEGARPAREAVREAILRRVAALRSNGGAAFVFLVGSAAEIPPRIERVKGLTRGTCASDVVYARTEGDSMPRAAVGRFPSSDPEAVRAYVDRVLAYESVEEPAGWRRRIAFLAGSGGFGAAADGAIDAAVSGLLDRELPAAYDLRVLRSDPSSAFGVKPSGEAAAIDDLWNAGSLIFLFAGHGSRHGLHTATGMGLTRTIFTTDRARRLSIRNGAPFVLMFACNTAEFAPPVERAAGVRQGEESEPSCIAEALLVNPRGAIAVVGASEVSHPYPDLLLAHELNGVFGESPRLGIGAMLSEAKRRMVRPEGEFRSKVDAIAGLFGLGEEERIRLVDHEVALYQLLGDPALTLQAPTSSLVLVAPSTVRPGAEFEFAVSGLGLVGAHVTARLERSRAASPRTTGYPAANVRTVAQVIGEATGETYRARMTVPPDATVRRWVLTVEAMRRSNRTQGGENVATESPFHGIAAWTMRVAGP